MVQLFSIFLRNLAFCHQKLTYIIVPLVIAGYLKHLLDEGAYLYDGVRKHLIVFLQGLSQVPVYVPVKNSFKGLGFLNASLA